MDIFLRQEIFTRPSKFANFSPTRARWKTCRLAILPFIFHKNLWKSKFLEIFHKERKKNTWNSPRWYKSSSKIINSKNSIHIPIQRKRARITRTNECNNKFTSQRGEHSFDTMYIFHDFPLYYDTKYTWKYYYCAFRLETAGKKRAGKSGGFRRLKFLRRDPIP